MDSRKILKIASLIFVIGAVFFVYSTYNPSQNNLFVPCPIKYSTGYDCPGCGSQRAIHQIFHFNFYNAFRLNPLMVLSLPLIIYGLGLAIWNWVFDTRYRVKLFYSNVFIYTYFGLVILYWIARNLPFYPFNLLAPTEP